MKTFQTYPEAHKAAAELATAHSRDIGLTKTREFNSIVYSIFMLPRPEFRTGRELTCEVVRPGDPA
jgi:hypothetical protein